MNVCVYIYICVCVCTKHIYIYRVQGYYPNNREQKGNSHGEDMNAGRI